jgi:hypothetical protein
MLSSGDGGAFFGYVGRRALSSVMFVKLAGSGAAGFANVDLDVASRADLGPLIAAFKPRAFCLHGSAFRRGGLNVATFELSRQPRNADTGIRAFVALIDSLPPKARALWNGATKRDFNVGVEAAERPQVFTVHAETVALAGRVRGSISFTVYPLAADRG